MIGFRYTRITPLWLTCHGNLTFLMPIKVALLLLMKQLVKMWRWRNKQEISGYREYFKDDQYLGTEMFGIVTFFTVLRGSLVQDQREVNTRIIDHIMQRKTFHSHMLTKNM